MAESVISAGWGGDLSATASLFFGLAQGGGWFKGHAGLGGGAAASGFVRQRGRLDRRPHATLGIAGGGDRRAANHLIELGYRVIGDVIALHLVGPLADLGVREHLHF